MLGYTLEMLQFNGPVCPLATGMIVMEIEFSVFAG
jgi:hypothetical protein